MDEKHRFTPPAVGVSSLLVIFTVLCLTIFALLSLTTVRANIRLADHSADAIAAYYKADCAAEAILARLRGGEQPENVTVDGDVYSYACPISDTQMLSVSVKISGRDDYRILQWQMVSTIDWKPDTELDLWDGELHN